MAYSDLQVFALRKIRQRLSHDFQVMRTVVTPTEANGLYKQEFNQILEVVLHDSSSCTSSSSEDDDLDLLLLEFAFAYP